MKKVFIVLLLSLCVLTAQAQQNGAASADTSKAKADTTSIPLKYQNIHKRSPVLACALSLYIAGLGQMYNKQYLKGGVLLGVWALSFGAAEVYHSNNTSHPHDGVTVALLVPFFASYIYSAIDAPVTASYLNKTYHLGKKKRALSSLSISPGFMNTAQSRYAGGVSLVLR